jgi:phosphoglycerol transferase MdoB-like AlkP superfamily enzyme
MIAVTSDTFSRTHIALTALGTGVIVLGFGIWRLQERRPWLTGLSIAVLVTAAVFLWRASANMPQLNRDGLAGYSANDWLAPVVVFVVLSVYADLFPPSNERRFAQVRAAATIAAFVVNVVTI